MDELLEQFLIEAPELAQQASDDLLALEQTPGDAALVDSAFRAIHTLKGSVALFDLAPMGQALHAAEDLMGELRSGRLTPARGHIDALMRVIGATDRWLGALAAQGALPQSAADEAHELARRVRDALPDLAGAAGSDATPSRSADWSEAILALARLASPGQEPLSAARYRPDRDCYFRGEDPLALLQGAPGILALDVQLDDAVGGDEPYDPFACRLVATLASSAPLADLKSAFRFAPDQVEFIELSVDATGGFEPTTALGKSLRISTERIDALADIVDELVVASNSLADLNQQAQDLDVARLRTVLADRQAAIDRLVGRLHRTVMGVRLAPIAPLLRRFPRLAREIAADLGKEATVTIDGGDVEVDKTILDALADPLTHLVRNAADHGLESPAERRAAGKPAAGKITLTTRRQGDMVAIAVEDDGRGVDPDKVRRTAVARQLLDDTAAQALSDEQALDLIFQPGFSTAQNVTQISGRGVGMDAVRDAVARLGGEVVMTSVQGQGSRVTLTLPLSLLLTKVLVVTCQGDQYAVPLDSVEETLRIRAEALTSVRAGRAFILRDSVVPLVDLADVLGAENAARPAVRRALIVRLGAELAAVAVDEIVGAADVVVRPMAGLLTRMRGLAGTTLTADGRVMMVLNLAEIV